MKKLLMILTFGIVAASCADGSIYSGDVYTAGQAKGERQVSYGTLVAVRPITVKVGSDGAVGGVSGAVLGGVAGNTIGGGSGRNVATAAGAIVGGIIGNQVEHGINRKQGVELEIRKDNGEVIAVVQTDGTSQFRAGQRVRLVGSGRSINVSPL